MATPTPSWGTHRVYGTWNNLDGSRKAGNYVATLAIRVTNATDDVIIPQGIVDSGTLNTLNLAAASLDINVPANDDPDNTPNDWLITLDVTFNDAPPEHYVLDTPLGGTTNLRQIIFPQIISDEPFGYLRGAPGGVAGLDEDGDVIDANGDKVTGSGTGLPVGGTTGQMVRKNSSTDGDATWQTITQDLISDGSTNRSYTNTEKSKLAGIASGATANSADATLLNRANHTGTQNADTLTDGTTNKAFLATERTKLAGIASGATANSTDSALRDRSTHTGTQAQSTVTNLTTDLAAKAPKTEALGFRTKTGGVWPARPSGFTCVVSIGDDPSPLDQVAGDLRWIPA